MSQHFTQAGSRRQQLAAGLVHQQICVRLAMLASALIFGGAMATAKADPRLSFDIGSASATAVLALPTTVPTFKLGEGFVADIKLPRLPNVLDVFGPLAPLQPDEMAGRHRIKWHYDENWSSSLASDFPKSSTPSYLIGHDDPGVPQRIWVQFSLTRHF